MDTKGTWIVEPSFNQRHMIVEIDETDDGRLVADRMTLDDAQRAVSAVNTQPAALAALRWIRKRLAPLGGDDVNECLIIIDAVLRPCEQDKTT